MKKKIGIVSLHTAINYGVYLQAYAMQEKVKLYGYEPEIIHYTKKIENTPPVSKYKKALRYLTNPKETKKVYRTKKLRAAPDGRNRAFAFEKFSASHFYLSRMCNNYDDVKELAQRYDACVCGSDQIWNPLHTKCNPVYFLQFVSPEKRVAYSPSIANPEIPDNLKDTFRAYVRSFSDVSVRETSGSELIEKETGIKAPAVVDPTLLFDGTSWDKIACSRIVAEPYVFCYFLGHSPVYDTMIRRAKEMFGMKIIAAPFTYEMFENPDVENRFASIEEFLALVRDAEFVMTDSFHGCAFSANYRKNFAVISRSDTFAGRNLRITDFLGKIGLSDRIVTEENADTFGFSPIDYKEPDRLLTDWIRESDSYFENALAKATNFSKEHEPERKQNVSLHEKTDCYGCTACASVCPVHAIEMVQDERHFLYPQVDDERCINCGLCLKKCGIHLNNIERHTEFDMKNYVAWETDEQKLLKSSSGGIFYAVAEKLVGEGYYVCGAVYSDDFRAVQHIISNKIEDVQKMRGSKYAQSNKGTLFKDVKSLLEKGEKVFCTGSPCEMASLQLYLGRKYDSLITMSYICHGPNAPIVLEKFIDLKEDEYQSKMKDFTMRYKKNNRIFPFHIRAEFENGDVYCEKFILSAYTRIFYGNLALRPSCNRCRFRAYPPFTDLYIGDVSSMYDYNIRGASSLFVGSKKGMEIIEDLKDRRVINVVDESLMKMTKTMPRTLTVAKTYTYEKQKKFWDLFETKGLVAAADFAKPVPTPLHYVIDRMKSNLKRPIAEAKYYLKKRNQQ